MSPNPFLCVTFLLAYGLANPEVACGRSCIWKGGNGDWDALFYSDYWILGSYDGQNSVTINTGHVVRLTQPPPFVNPHRIDGLSLSGRSTLNLNNRSLSIRGFASVSGDDTLLDVTRGFVTSRGTTVSSGGTISMGGGYLYVMSVGSSSTLTIGTGGILSGNGTISPNRGNPSYPVYIDNNGTISASNPSALPSIPPEAGRLVFSWELYGDSPIDLDGSLETGAVIIGRNQTLENEIPLTDEFNGRILMLHDSKLEMGHPYVVTPSPWQLGNGGTIEIDNGATADTSAGTATILRAAFTQAGGTIAVVDSDGTLLLDAPFTFTGGLLANNGRVILKKNSSIAAAATFTGTGALIIADGSETVTEPGINVNTALELQGSLRIGSSDTITEVTAKALRMVPTADLNVDIIGTSPNQHDRVVINGSAELDGHLNLHFGEVSPGVPFVPAVGQKFSFLSASGGVSGTFKALSTGALPEGLGIKINYLPTAVEAEVITGDEFELWVHRHPSIGTPAGRLRTADPDQDGLNNLIEFALDADPGSSKASGKVVSKIATVAGETALTLTFPVHNANESYDAPGGELLVIGMGSPPLHYKAQGSGDLASFGLDVERVTGADATAIQAGLPPLSPGWTYVTCRSTGPLTAGPKKFLRVDVSEGPLPP